MEKKIKLIIFGLAGILVINLFFIIQLNNQKVALERERDKIKKENVSLMASINESNKQNQRLREAVDSLNRDLEIVTKEKEEVRRKYETVDKERQELLEQIKSLKQEAGKVGAAPGQEQAMPSVNEAYWAGILKTKRDLELQLESLRSELKTAQLKNEELLKNKATLELDINTLIQETQDLKRQLEYNKKVMDGIAQELVREKDDKFQIQNSFKMIKNENKVLKQQLRSLDTRKFNLEKKLAELQKENVHLQNSLTEMDLFLKDKMLQIDKLKKDLEERPQAQEGEASQETKKITVELPPIVVRPQAEINPPEATSLAGKILAVNKDNNFVIVDLGENRGIKLGDILHAYRGTQEIGTLEVIQVRPGIAACDIKKQNLEIAIGDTVR